MIQVQSVIRISALVALLLVSACGGYSKETVSLYRDHVGMRVPNQQRLLALSSDEAVARLDFKGLAGKTVVVEMSGIFPHTRADVLDYIQGQIEGKIARDGGLVISSGQLVTAPVEGTGGEPATVLNLTPSEAEYRVVIGVSWAGVDTHDRKVINSKLLTRQLGVMGAGLGIALLGPPVVDDSTAGPILAGIGGLTLLTGIAWYIFDKPQLHVIRLLGRVRVSVNAIPIVPGGTPFQTIGEGQTELLIDPTAEEGYVLQ